MEEQEKAIGMKSIRAYTGVLTYIDTVSGKTIPENEYEMKYKDYTAKIRHENITDVRNQLTTTQYNDTKNNNMTDDIMVTPSSILLSLTTSLLTYHSSDKQSQPSTSK